MSEPRSEPASAETTSSNSAAAAETPRIAPDQEETAPGAAAPKVEAARPEPPRASGKLLVMSPGERPWDKPDARVETEPGSGKRRASAMAAVIALAAVAGAIGGAAATAGFGYFAGGEPAAGGSAALQAQIVRFETDLVTLKASVEQTAKMATTQFNRAGDRLDKVEKAQAEPAAKLARLSEAVEKLRAPQPAAVAAAAPAAVAPAAARDVTGSIAPPSTASSPAPAPSAKTEVGRLPTVEGWVLRDIGQGGALIESRHGIFEVYPGEPVPGLGRVDAIRRQDGRWVVVTSKGLIVER